MDKQVKKKKSRRIRPRHIFLCCLAVVCVLGCVTISQKQKLEEIHQQQQALQEEMDSLLLEEQRLQRMQEYVQTDEYLEQYARERFGYVLPEDYKFYREDEDGD